MDMGERLVMAAGREVLIRPIEANDADALRRAILAAVPETIRLRFLGGRPPLWDKQLQTLVEREHLRREALGALTDEGHLVGIVETDIDLDLKQRLPHDDASPRPRYVAQPPAVGIAGHDFVPAVPRPGSGIWA